MELDGSDPRIHAMVGTYEHGIQAMRSGDIQAAVDGFRTLAEDAKSIGSMDSMSVGSASIHQIAQLCDGALQDNEAALAEAFLGALPPGSEPSWMLQFSLAGFAAAHNHPAQAMDWLDKANAAKRAAIHYDPDMIDKLFSVLISTFDIGLIDHMTQYGSKSDKPIFIVGMPRSGTTLVEQVLASIPGIHGAGELSAVANVARNIFKVEGAWPRGASGLSPERVGALAEQYLAEITALAPDASRIIDKMPMNFQNLGLILGLFPNATILHIERDPLDVCFGCYRQLFNGDVSFAYNQTELGRYFRNYERIMQHWRTIAPGRIIDVSYTRLITEFETEARAMVAATGLPWSDDALDFHKTERINKTASAHQVRQPLFMKGLNASAPYEPYLAPLMAALRGNPEASLQAAYPPAA